MVTGKRAALRHTPSAIIGQAQWLKHATQLGEGAPKAKISSVELLICQPTEICQRPAAQGAHGESRGL